MQIHRGQIELSLGTFKELVRENWPKIAVLSAGYFAAVWATIKILG